jgi:hypothetical protein
MVEGKIRAIPLVHLAYVNELAGSHVYGWYPDVRPGIIPGVKTQLRRRCQVQLSILEAFNDLCVRASGMKPKAMGLPSMLGELTMTQIPATFPSKPGIEALQRHWAR